MAQFKGLLVNKNGLGSTTEVLGQMILCQDTDELFFDTQDNGRIKITDIVWFDTDQDRLSSTPTQNKIYIVKSTSKIWVYSEQWYNLNEDIIIADSAQDGNLNPISSNAVFDAITVINNSITSTETQLRIELTDLETNLRSEISTSVGNLETSITELETELRTEISTASTNLSSRSYTIDLLSTNWVLRGQKYVQSPTYSTEIFGGTLYDADVNIVIGLDPNYAGDYSVIAKPNAGQTALEFFTDILPEENLILNVIVIP